MNLIIKDRGEGKTTDLIRMSSETWTYIVVVDRDRALNIRRMADDMGLDIPFPITYAECLNSLRGARFGKVYIDDADDFIQHFFDIQTGNKIKVDTITMTKG